MTCDGLQVSLEAPSVLPVRFQSPSLSVCLQRPFVQQMIPSEKI